MSVPEPTLDDLIGQLGVFGKYQAWQHFLHAIASFLAGLHMLSLTFVAPTPPHRCYIKEIDGLGAKPTFNTSILSSFIPVYRDGRWDSCHKYESSNLAGNEANKDITSCSGHFIYDTTTYTHSRVFEWDMVCENKWQRAMIQTIYVFGVFNGAVICGALADKFGRKPILYISAVFQFVFGFGGVFITNYIAYSISLFFYGFFGSGGGMVTGFVLSSELINKKYRAKCAAAYAGCFAIGVSSNALWGYLIRDGKVLQTVISAQALLLFGHFWFVDESIRWLWGQGRIEEATAIVKKACRMNGSPYEELLYDDSCSPPSTAPLQSSTNSSKKDEETCSSASSSGNKKYGLVDLFRKPGIGIRAIITIVLWFSAALCYYGLAFNTGALPGNPYLVFFLISIVDLIGQGAVAVVADVSGRRPLNLIAFAVGGIACLVLSFIPRGLVVTVIAVIAKISMAGCFTVMYNYTAELFPTVVRNSAVGLGSMAARFGGMLTPQINLLEAIDSRIPTLVFGCVALFASCMSLFLPETVNAEMPETFEDDKFHLQDNPIKKCWRSCFNRPTSDIENKYPSEGDESDNGRETLTSEIGPRED